MRIAIPSLTAVALLLVTACSGSPPERAERTPEEQRAADSTVGASRLPGAGGVRGAMAASDSAAQRAKLLDSLSKQP